MSGGKEWGETVTVSKKSRGTWLILNHVGIDSWEAFVFLNVFSELNRVEPLPEGAALLSKGKEVPGSWWTLRRPVPQKCRKWLVSVTRGEGIRARANYVLTTCLFTTLNVCLTNNDRSTIDVFMCICSKTAPAAGSLVLSTSPGPRKFLTLSWVGLVWWLLIEGGCWGESWAGACLVFPVMSVYSCVVVMTQLMPRPFPPLPLKSLESRNQTYVAGLSWQVRVSGAI